MHQAIAYALVATPALAYITTEAASSADTREGKEHLLLQRDLQLLQGNSCREGLQVRIAQGSTGLAAKVDYQQ